MERVPICRNTLNCSFSGNVAELTARVTAGASLHLMTRQPVDSLWHKTPTTFDYTMVGPLVGRVRRWDVLAFLEENPSWISLYISEPEEPRR